MSAVFSQCGDESSNLDIAVQIQNLVDEPDPQGSFGGRLLVPRLLLDLLCTKKQFGLLCSGNLHPHLQPPHWICSSIGRSCLVSSGSESPVEGRIMNIINNSV